MSRPTRHLSILALCLGAALAGPSLAAKTTVIDDSGTLPYDAPLVLRWQQLSPRRPVNNTMTGTASIRVRLNVGAWLHRTGRIYLMLPAQQPASLSASWTTQGRLEPGQIAAGSRTLVYAGPITTPFIEDVLQLTLNVDARQLRQLYHVNFQFQMDE
ncbi:MAG TPA: hypothetical protein VET66_01630 [Steroidobacteraceae bacterium]|nr:hypothetical protein [Steroidobacteraceae bacterium]